MVGLDLCICLCINKEMKAMVSQSYPLYCTKAPHERVEDTRGRMITLNKYTLQFRTNTKPD